MSIHNQINGEEQEHQASSTHSHTGRFVLAFNTSCSIAPDDDEDSLTLNQKATSISLLPGRSYRVSDPFRHHAPEMAAAPLY